MKRLFLLVALLSLTACPTPVHEYLLVPSFVLDYHELTQISISLSSRSELKLLVDFKRGEYYAFGDRSEERLAQYNFLCEKHNDVTYKLVRKIYREFHNPRCARDFIRFEIVCASDWDESHPAGSSLGNIVRFRSSTPWPYIRSGYKQKYSDDREGGEYYPVDCLVSELTPDDMTLLPSRGIALQFQQPPASPGPYTLTVRMTTDDDEVFETSGTFEF